MKTIYNPLIKNIKSNCKAPIYHFEYQQPDEFRVDTLLKELCSSIAISTAVLDSEHFYTSTLIG
jgi:deoxyribodipyrimidine photolyase-related protein